MAKKHTLTLDIDLDDENPLLDDIAILLFQTDTPNYLFADDLNHLYRLALARLDDLSLLEASCPIFTYHDTISYLDYYLIDPSANCQLPTANCQLLVIRGEGADGIADTILHDFNDPPDDADANNPFETLKQTSNQAILLAYQQALTAVSLYDPQPPAGLSRKAAKEHQELGGLLTALLDLIDLQHL